MIFLRHPTPDISPGICYGQLDMDIAPIGHGQIEEALRDTPPVSQIIASPALRCQKLALLLADREGLQPTFDERLWEMHMGDWEGIAWKDIDRSLSDQWLKDAHNNSTPNGESFRDVQLRVSQCITEITTDSDTAHEEIAIICHASPIRATQMAWEGLSFKQAFAQTPPYATPIHIVPTG